MKRYEIRICNLEDVWTVYTVTAKSMISAENIALEMHKDTIKRIETVEFLH